MKTVLRILMVEDSEDDALLTLHQIKKGGFDIEYERVETADSMRALLREQPWDIILSDYKMPHFNGMEALIILKESGLDIPFIMISGTIGEDVAVEAMRIGAQDYIMKNNVHRLLPAIERELRESKNRTERKRAEDALYDAQQVFRTLVENSPDIIARYDQDCRRTYVNPTFLKIAQISQQEVLSTTPMQRSLLPASSAAVLQNLLGRVLDSGVAETIDVIGPMAGGRDSWYNIYAFPEFDREGRVVSVMAISRDITVRKQAEEALRQNEERLRSLFENAPDAIYIQSGGRFVYLNSAMVKLLGASGPEEFLGREFIERVAPQYHETIRQRIQFQQETGKTASLMEQEYLRLDGSRIPVETTAVMVQYQGDDAHMVFVRDITERKEAEGKLLLSAKEWAETFDTMSDGVSIQSDDFVVLRANKTMARLLDKSKEEIIGQKCFEIIHCKSDPIEDCPLTACKVTKKEEYVEIFEPVLGKWVAVSTSPILDEQGTIQRIIHTIRDVTKRKRAEEALKESEAKFRALVEHSSDGICMSRENHVLFANQALLSLFNYETLDEFNRVPIAEHVTPEFVDRVRSKMELCQQGSVSLSQMECSIVRKNGDIRDVIISSAPVVVEGQACVQCTFRDVTEIKKAEEQLRLHQANMSHLLRLGEVGEMASGLAHEINQPLCAIENYAQACLRLMERNPDMTRLGEVLKEIREQAERAGKIIHRVKGLVRKKMPQFTFIQIDDIIRESIDLVSMNIRKRKVKFNVNVPDNLGPVYVDSVLIEQVILNLIRNGLEAMDSPAIRKKELTIQALPCSNDKIEVCVSDTGCGIPAENMKKIFESFFTTKSEGLGIGLSLSRAIIESHSGQIWATANADGGTTFHFTVPNIEKISQSV